jgi:hypothetical protein
LQSCSEWDYAKASADPSHKPSGRLQARLPAEFSAPVDDASAPKIMEVDLADYFDPPKLEWTKADYRASEAARVFGESCYADH